MKKIKPILLRLFTEIYSVKYIFSLIVMILFFTYCPIAHVMSLRELHAASSSLVILLSVLVLHRIIALIAILVNSKKYAQLNDWACFFIAVLLVLAGTVWQVSRGNSDNPPKSHAYDYFNNCCFKLEDFNYSFSNYQSLLEPESWELFGGKSVDIRFTYVTCLTETIAHTYQRAFLRDYSDAALIQTINTDEYVLTMVESETQKNGKPDGDYVKSLVCVKGKRVAVLQIYGSYTSVNSSFAALQQRIIDYFATFN
ncbi:MAG: hypothetical protein IIY94_03435 [Oscillospiraceae bacterium]|nr:hypothetical protein [Oscillospiraceae bacterium]